MGGEGVPVSDRELLQMAAKAAGMTLGAWREAFGAFMYRDVAPGRGYWNPLTDDGDALRLAVKLGLSPEVHLDASQPLPWLRVAHRSRDARGVYSEQWHHVGPQDYGAEP